jgi:hypothetical protein
MVNMFKNNYIFNQDIKTQIINEGADDEYTAWNTLNVSDVTNMFYGCTDFDQDIRNWNVLSVSVDKFGNMFNHATAMSTTYTGISGFGTTPDPWFWNIIDEPEQEGKQSES